MNARLGGRIGAKTGQHGRPTHRPPWGAGVPELVGGALQSCSTPQGLPLQKLPPKRFRNPANHKLLVLDAFLAKPVLKDTKLENYNWLPLH